VRLNSGTDHRVLILSPARCLLVDEFDLPFMLAIVRNADDDGPCPDARVARVECKHEAYDEAFKVHSQMVLRVHEVLDRPVFLNTRVNLVSSTVEAIFGVIFVKGMHSFISPRRLPCAKHQVANEDLVEKLHWNLAHFDARHVALHDLNQMHPA